MAGGKRTRRRPSNDWIDDIKKLTVTATVDCLRAARDQEKFVARISKCLQDLGTESEEEEKEDDDEDREDEEERKLLSRHAIDRFVHLPYVGVAEWLRRSVSNLVRSRCMCSNTVVGITNHKPTVYSAVNPSEVDK